MINIEKEREDFEAAWLVPHELSFFDFKDNQYVLKDNFVDDSESPIANETYHSLNSGWSMWLKAKAHEAKKLEGCVVVPKTELDTYYLDESEGMYSTDSDFLADIDIGEAVEVERQYYWKTNSLFAAITWDKSNSDVECYEFYDTQEEAEQAAAHCKAMVEAARGGNE